jgi:hypothetical protein
LMPVCPRQDFCDIVLEASRPRVLVCHNSSLTPRCPRGYSPPNECVLTSGFWRYFGVKTTWSLHSHVL